MFQVVVHSSIGLIPVGKILVGVGLMVKADEFLKEVERECDEDCAERVRSWIGYEHDDLLVVLMKDRNGNEYVPGV
jgi:hypothetical protein